MQHQFKGNMKRSGFADGRVHMKVLEVEFSYMHIYVCVSGRTYKYESSMRSSPVLYLQV